MLQSGGMFWLCEAGTRLDCLGVGAVFAQCDLHMLQSGGMSWLCEAGTQLDCLGVGAVVAHQRC